MSVAHHLETANEQAREVWHHHHHEPWVSVSAALPRRLCYTANLYPYSAGVACAVKTAYIPKIGTWLDFTYNSADVLIWGLSETSITIVAASIPFLRVLVREKSSHGRSYQLGSSSHPYDVSSRSKSAGFHMEPVVKRKTDESSDKSILNEAGPGGIVQTNEIRIEYGSDEERDVEGLEKIQKEIARYGAARS
jgi:hypothetical protein